MFLSLPASKRISLLSIPTARSQVQTLSTIERSKKGLYANMYKLFLSLSLVLISACSTTSKKLIDLPPLAKDAPVEVFYSKPNLKFDEVCTIKFTADPMFQAHYTQKEDLRDFFIEEARKCGADGVIVANPFFIGDSPVTAYGVGIRILGKGAALVGEEKIKSFSLAIQSHDLQLIRELLSGVSIKTEERAPTDDMLVNLGLYIASLDGLNCDSKIVRLLEYEYGGHVPKFKAVQFFAPDTLDSNTPLCLDVMARSFPKMKDQLEAVLAVNNHYVELLNHPNDALLGVKAKRYSNLLKVAAKAISASCKASSTHPVCATKGSYLDFANKSVSSQSAPVRRNAREVLLQLK